MTRPKPRTERCDAAATRSRLSQANSLLAVAELTADENDPDLEYAGVSTALAVLAGVAAVDAACCFALHERSRGQDHREAARLLAEVDGGAEQVPKFLRLLGLKDKAHYGFVSASQAEAKTAVRGASALVEFAQTVLRV